MIFQFRKDCFQFSLKLTIKDLLNQDKRYIQQAPGGDKPYEINKLAEVLVWDFLIRFLTKIIYLITKRTQYEKNVNSDYFLLLNAS